MAVFASNTNTNQCEIILEISIARLHYEISFLSF